MHQLPDPRTRYLSTLADHQSMTESALYGEILRAHSHGPTRLFRQHSVMAWAGKIVSRTANTVTLLHPYPIKVGTPGISDLGGLTCVLITPEMIGQHVGIYLAIEAKFGRGRATTEQADFIAMVRGLGGRAGIARSADEAARIIEGRSL